MKKVVLAVLIGGPLAFAVFHHPAERPVVDRLANEQRVQELRSFLNEGRWTRRWEQRIPEARGYPFDPDCLSSGYEP